MVPARIDTASFYRFRRTLSGLAVGRVEPAMARQESSAMCSAS
jgi:hypothetical protein